MAPEILLKHSSCAGLAPAAVFALICEGFNEMVQEGLLDGSGKFGIDATDYVVWVEVDGEPISFATFQRLVAPNVLVITLGYTEPSSRRCGHFKSVLKELLRWARTQDVASIQISTRHDNDEARKLLTSVGAALHTVQYVLDV